MRSASRASLRAIPLALAIAGILAAGLLGCATSLPGSGASGQGGGPGAKAIRIGGVGPLTGEAAFFGIATKKAYELAIEEWNEAGGLLGRRLELVFADDEGNPVEGGAAFERLIKAEKVVGIVGSVMSRVSLAGAPLAQAAGIPLISPTSTNPKVTEVGDYIFRACFVDPYQGRIGARFAFRNLGLRRAAVLSAFDDAYAKGLADEFSAEFERLGGDIVSFQTHDYGIPDFRPRLAEILRAEPELVYLPDYYNEVAPIAVRLRELGYRGPLLGGDGWDAPELIERGGAAVEGGFFTNHFFPEDPSPEVQSFAARYRARFGEAPSALAALGYDAMQLLLDAIRRAGSVKGSDIREALGASDLDAVTGRIRFDELRNPIKPAVIIEIRDGRQVFKARVNP